MFLFVPLQFFESIAYQTIYPFLVDEYRYVDYVGTFSYKVATTELAGFRFDSDAMLQLLHIAFESGYDVVPILRSRGDKYLGGGVRYHGAHFKLCWDSVLSSIGFSEATIRHEDYGHPFYRNAFFSRPRYFKLLSAYMSNAITQVMLNETVESIFREQAFYTGKTGNITEKAFHGNHYSARAVAYGT